MLDANLAALWWLGSEWLVAQHFRPAEPRRHHRRLFHPGQGSALGATGGQQEIGEPAEASFIDTTANQLLELLLPAARHVESRFPVPEGAVAVRHLLKLHGGDVVPHRQ